MSKTVVIPNDRNPFEVEINGTEKYSYPAGTTQEVPDAVAEIIEQYNARLQKPNAPFIRPSMPTAGEDGDALVSVGGKWEKQDGYGYESAKPFDDITWDGNTEGRDVATISAGGIDFKFYKVADYIEGMSAEMLYGCTVTVTSGEEVETHKIDGNDAEVYEDEEILCIGNDVFFVVASESAKETEFQGMPASIPSAGVYFFDGSVIIAEGTYVSGMYAESSAVKIDSKYIPSPSVPFISLECYEQDGSMKMKSMNSDDIMTWDEMSEILAEGKPMLAIDKAKGITYTISKDPSDLNFGITLSAIFFDGMESANRVRVVTFMSGTALEYGSITDKNL